MAGESQVLVRVGGISQVLVLKPSFPYPLIHLPSMGQVPPRESETFSLLFLLPTLAQPKWRVPHLMSLQGVEFHELSLILGWFIRILKMLKTMGQRASMNSISFPSIQQPLANRVGEKSENSWSFRFFSLTGLAPFSG